MRKTIIFIVIVVSLFLFLGILNMEVSILQGVNYKVREVKMPLYLKLLDFFDRHFNYKLLVKEIVKGAESNEEKALMLFKWTCGNIKDLPSGLPVMDDHVWYTIIRGYGVSDQSSDVFTTLCNYAGLDAFLVRIGTERIPLSFVKLKDRWRVFDPYHGTYFKDEKENIADVDTVKSNNWKIEYLKEKPNLDYAELFQSLPSIKAVGLRRASIQSPLNRLSYEISKLLKK